MDGCLIRFKDFVIKGCAMILLSFALLHQPEAMTFMHHCMNNLWSFYLVSSLIPRNCKKAVTYPLLGWRIVAGWLVWTDILPISYWVLTFNDLRHSGLDFWSCKLLWVEEKTNLVTFLSCFCLLGAMLLHVSLIQIRLISHF